MQIQQALAEASSQLQHISDSAQLDAACLLAHVLQVPHSYLIAWPEHVMSVTQLQMWHALLARRVQGEPVAYLLGYKEFWSLPFRVNQHTLIPRPETELLVATTLQLIAQVSSAKVADLGTGCGAIAVALAHEQPAWEIYAVDASQAALDVAATNVATLQVPRVHLLHSDWFSALTGLTFDAIVANPPYIDRNDGAIARAVSDYEPQQALFAADHGLAELTKIIEKAPQFLIANGWLLVEHGYQQGFAVRSLLQQHRYTQITTLRDIAGHERVTYAQFPPKCEFSTAIFAGEAAIAPSK